MNNNEILLIIELNRIIFHTESGDQVGHLDIYHINAYQLELPIKNYMSAWQLHQILEIKLDYSEWIKQ